MTREVFEVKKEAAKISAWLKSGKFFLPDAKDYFFFGGLALVGFGVGQYSIPISAILVGGIFAVLGLAGGISRRVK